MIDDGFEVDISLIPQGIVSVCQVLKNRGGEAWLVGGCVRDLVLGTEPKDWDIEIYGLEYRALVAVLSDLGRYEEVGRSFGVIKLWFDGLEVDVALPRVEVKSGAGHKGFDVTHDAFLPVEKAVLRRDFSINAMMYDPVIHRFLDFHHGLNDLKEKRLRHVSEKFVEDPLRPLRAMQFAARFQLSLDQETAAVCATLTDESRTLPASRVWQEWLKWCESPVPSFGLRALRDMGWLALYPELEATVDCQQDARWHPEGDVWIHMGQVVDQAARLRRERKLSADDGVILMLAALCHDLGKPLVARRDEQGLISMSGHAQAGLLPCRGLMVRMAVPSRLQSRVLLLVQEHGAHFAEEPGESSVLRLAARLDPVSIQLWEMLAESDASGCFPLPPDRPALPWLKQAKELGVEQGKAKAIVTGKLLMKWGVEPSERMGELLQLAYKAQLDGIIVDEGSAYHWLKKM